MATKIARRLQLPLEGFEIVTMAIQKRSVQLGQLSNIHETVHHCCEHILQNDIDNATIDAVLGSPPQTREILVYLNIADNWHETYQQAKHYVEDKWGKPIPVYQLTLILVRHFLATG